MLLAFLIQHDLSSDYLDELGLGTLREHGAELIRSSKQFFRTVTLISSFLLNASAIACVTSA